MLTKPEHVSKTIAPFGEEVKVCSIDLRVGGNYHFVFVTDDGSEMSFRGTFLEIEPPTRTVETWLYDGWPGVEAVETMDLREADGVTKLTHTLAFRDQAGRDHMTGIRRPRSELRQRGKPLEVTARSEGNGLRVTAFKPRPGADLTGHPRPQAGAGAAAFR